MNPEEAIQAAELAEAETAYRAPAGPPDVPGRPP